jgi:integrase
MPALPETSLSGTSTSIISSGCAGVARCGLPNATWLTFRCTYASWAHDKGVPGKVIAQLMGHTNADVTLNVYTQVLDDSLRSAVDRVGNELFTIVHSGQGATELTH